VNGHDVPRTFLYLAFLVSAHTWGVVALAQASVSSRFCGPQLAALIGIAARRWHDA